MLPNFLIIGAAKAGTSALYHFLNQHPQVFMAKQKELRFFSSIDNPEVQGPNVYKYDYIRSLEEYRYHFLDGASAAAVGEASPQYLYYPKSASRIFQIIPDVKLITVLRNPIERAYSSYLHAVRDWHEPEMEFAKALQNEQIRIKLGWPMLFHYVNAGLYANQLKPFFSHFNRNSLKIIIYDELINSPLDTLKDLFSFLEINTSFEPNLSLRPNISGYPKNKRLYRFYKYLFKNNNVFRSFLTNLIPKSTRRSVASKLIHNNLSKVPMDEQTRACLQEIFIKDINSLQKMIGEDLSMWVFD